MAPSDQPGLHRTIYMSSAVGVLPAHQLDRILLRARAFNPSAGLTGLLSFYEGRFLQCIEGPEASVRSLMQRIAKDRRHNRLMELETAPCPSRAFPGQPMEYVAPRNLSTRQRAAFSALAQTASLPTPLEIGARLSEDVWGFLATFRESAAA